MLKLRLIARTALVTITLCTALPAVAQQGTSDRIEAAEKKLDADIKACRPIDPAEYKELVSETNRNVKFAKAAAQGGAPVDVSKLNSDLEKAGALYKRALEAAAKPCPPPQQQPQQAAPPEKKVEPPMPTTPIAGGVVTKLPKEPFEELQDDADDLLDELDEAMWECDLEWVQSLIPQLEEMAKKAHGIAKAAKALGKNSKVGSAKA